MVKSLREPKVANHPRRCQPHFNIGGHSQNTPHAVAPEVIRRPERGCGVITWYGMSMTKAL